MALQIYINKQNILIENTKPAMVLLLSDPDLGITLNGNLKVVTIVDPTEYRNHRNHNSRS